MTERIKHCLLLLLILLAGCSSPKYTSNIENACAILNTHKSWKNAFNQAYIEYGVPPHVIMAIIYQESRYVYNAKPPRKRFLGIPTVRPSTAYGFPQALDSTWDWYQESTNRHSADRDNLPDAVAFVAWYIQTNQQRTGVSKWDTNKQYLAYHEGSGGYLAGSYKKKPWLIDVAKKVENNAIKYRGQLTNCYQLPQI